MERPEAPPGDAPWFMSPALFWRQEEWRAIGYAQIPSGEQAFWQVVLVFETREYAERVAQAVANWQRERVPIAPGADQEADHGDAIRLGFVAEENEDYTLYLYPSPDLVPEDGLSVTFGKRVPAGPEFWFVRFANAYAEAGGMPFLLCFAYLQDGQPLLVQGTDPIWKTHAKIKWRKDVGPDEPEHRAR